MSLSSMKKLNNPFWGSIMLILIVGLRGLAHASGLPNANLLYALLPLPITILAYNGGMVIVTAAAMVTAIADGLLLPAFMHPAEIGSAAARLAVLEGFAFLMTVGAGVCAVCRSLRTKRDAEERRAEEYLKSLYLQKKENEGALVEAESNVQRCKEDIDRYSSLVLMLEEAAERLYANLDTESLFNSFILVMRKCLSARSGSIYLRDDDSTCYVMHTNFGYDDRPFDQPEIIQRYDPLVEYAVLAHRAIGLYDHETPDPRLRNAVPKSCISPQLIAPFVDHTDVAGLVMVKDFNQNAVVNCTRDTALLSMLCNITSVALSNARLFAKLQHVADRDPLTQLFNRRYFYDVLSKELSKARCENSNLCLLLCDIDHFKRVNDTYGHQAGDAILVEYAKTCIKLVRDCDIVARYGGEEFIILLPGLSAEEGAKAAERIRHAVAGATFEHENLELHITSSCGVASFPQHASDVTALTQAADLALYKAKASGRNKVMMATNDISESFSSDDQIQVVIKEHEHEDRAESTGYDDCAGAGGGHH